MNEKGMYCILEGVDLIKVLFRMEVVPQHHFSEGDPSSVLVGTNYLLRGNFGVSLLEGGET